ncbi:MAG TPA: hypothetical protein VJ753_05525 [Rhizomicrobium sp.]|nr:hypothetical protein [Rhizomicrobium sp.]
MKKSLTVMGAATLLNAAILPASGAARVEIPISQVLGANGRFYYLISLSVGGSAPVKTLLDTGSTGLRLLPDAIGSGDAVPTRRSSNYGYATGSQFTGTIAHGVVTIGGAKTTEPVSIMLIDKVGCRKNRPNCPAAGLTARDFSFAQEAKMAEPNRARIGIRLASSDADNPLTKMGDGVWIVELPRPGEAAPGRLIVNPTPEEMANYKRLHVDPETGMTAGCVIDGSGSQKICGHVLPDTGGNGMIVEARQRPSSFPWPNGTPAILALVDDRDVKFGMSFTVKHVPGDPENLHWQQGDPPVPRISGSYPFLGHSVLFDANRREIGFKPR